MPTATLILNPGYPGALLWSKNTMFFRFTALFWGINNLIIDVQDDSGSIATLSYAILQSVTQIDLQKVLSTVVDPSRPADLSAGLPIATFQQVDAIKTAKVYYRLSSAPAPGTLATFKVMYGGLGTMSFMNEGDVNTYPGTVNVSKFLPDGNRLLSYVPTGRMMDYSEYGWLTYFQEVEAPVGLTPQAIYILTYNDNTVSIFYKPFPAGSLANTVWYIPVGIQQTGLDPTSKGVKSLDITIGAGGLGGTVYASYSISYTDTPLYTWMDIGYRNSLGGWDHFRFKGRIEFSTDAVRKDYFVRGNRFGSNPYFDTTMRPKWKANTGYISAQHMTALNDLLLSTDVCLLFEGNYYPIRCTSKSLKWRDTKDGLHNEVFEFETSGDFSVMPTQLMQFFKQYPENR
jgi:hypothetical protein